MVVSFVSPLNAFLETVFDVSLVDLMVIVLSFLHPLKALAPIFVTLPGSVIHLRELHPLNAFAPISVTCFPIVTFLSLVAPLNAFLPMVLILLPIVTLVTVLLPLNALSEICVTLYVTPLIFTADGMVTVFAFLFAGALYWMK